MKTSYVQYTMMIEFMEKHGDLSKPGGGPMIRHYIDKKWIELTEILNSDKSGDSRKEKKWRKVWSDYKNYTKKKLAKANQEAGDPCGRSILQMQLSNLENRAIKVIGMPLTIETEAAEAIVKQERVEGWPSTTLVEVEAHKEILQENPFPDNSAYRQTIMGVNLECDTPGPSSEPTASFPSSDDEEWQPSPKRQKKGDKTRKQFLKSHKSAREYAREHDRMYERLENERLRLQEIDIRERVRQRDRELELEGKWLEFMKEAMNVVVKLVERK